jgi:hypothetical protein
MMLPLSFSIGAAEFTVKKAALRVGVDHVLKNGLVGRAGRSPAGDAGVGKDNIEFAEIFGQGCEEPLAIFRNGDVNAVATCARSEFSDCCIERLLVATSNGDLRALRNEKSGCGKADATVTAGNKSLLMDSANIENIFNLAVTQSVFAL